jgi:hypothetical protein
VIRDRAGRAMAQHPHNHRCAANSVEILSNANRDVVQTAADKSGTESTKAKNNQDLYRFHT